MRLLQITAENIPYVISRIWLASFASNAPLFVYRQYQFKNTAYIQSYSSQAELTHKAFYTVFVFIVPFIVIRFCRRKLIKSLCQRNQLELTSNGP